MSRPNAPADPARDTIVLTVWSLVVSNPTGPESDELVGQLVDRARNLPTVASTTDEVRDLVSKLRAAGLLRKSREFRLTTIDGQATRAESGTKWPRIIATNISTMSPNRGGRNRPPSTRTVGARVPPAPDGQANESPWSDAVVTNSIDYQEIGTVVELIPRIDSTGSVQVHFSYNASDTEKAPDVPISEIPGRKPITADKDRDEPSSVVVRLKSGTAVVVQSEAVQAWDGESPTDTTQLLILAASVQPALE